MATNKNATYKVYNGTDWDTIYFATSAAQVGESTTLKFLRPSVNTVNGKAFTTTAGITLYASDIKMASNNSDTVGQLINALGIDTHADGTLFRIGDQGADDDPVLAWFDGKIYYGEYIQFDDDPDSGSEIATKNDIANASYSLPKASSSVLGGVKIGSHITVNDGVISITEEDVVEALGFTPVGSGEVGKKNGIAQLDSDGKVPSSQLPSYVDDVVEVASSDAMPGTGEAGKIYVTKDDNKTFRWSGTGYVEISASLALGETSSTAYAGDKGKANATAIATLQSNYSTLGQTVQSQGTAISGLGSKVDTATSNITKITNGSTAVGKATQLATARKFTIGATGKDFNGTAALTWTLAEINSYVRQVFEGSATPTGMRSGDIWLQYS